MWALAARRRPCRRVVGQHLHHLRVFGRGHVHGDVRLVVLHDPGAHRLAGEDRHVLADRVGGLHVLVGRDVVIRLVGAEHRDHVAVDVLQVVDRRRKAGSAG